ncbi:CRC domain-containing protein TSO1 [Bienertia sinuspersici]
MDTPERNQIGTPVSKTEESPFSNFINNLSPINQIKTVHVSQTFGSLSFSSPPSVFTSPHVSFQKDHKLLRRHQMSELVKHQFCSEEENDVSIAKEVTNAGQREIMGIEQDRGEAVSGNESSAKPLEDASEREEELPRVLKYDSGSPCRMTVTSSCMETNCEPDTSAALVQLLEEPSVKGSFGTKSNSQDMSCDNEEATDWQSLVSGSSDLLMFDSPKDVPTSKGSLKKSQEEETNVYASLMSRFPAGHTNGLLNSLPVGSSGCNEAYETVEHSTQTTEATELKHVSENMDISSVDEFFLGDSGEKSGKEHFNNLHRGFLRRCLTFEIPRSKRSMDGVLFSSSLSSLQNEEKPLLGDGQPITPATDSSRHRLQGIGLHLNALAAASKDCGISNQEIISPTTMDPLIGSSSLRKEESSETVVESAEDSSQASAYAATEELNPNSANSKLWEKANLVNVATFHRHSLKNLVTYCECFAAGVYCVEPCSCQDCFNKPIHEDTVLATRKQIESRNPLAFAPKVIRTADSAQDLGDDSTRTPASARHKRGCNCKKSNCLKKYCECYQGGVGCSVNCRCEGCKNAFGRKDGSTHIGTEVEMDKLHGPEKYITHKSSDVHELHNDDDQNSEFAIPQTPSKLYRQSLPLATSSKGKPPRSSLGTIGSSSILHPVDGPGRSTFLRSQSRMEKRYHQCASVDEIPAVLQNNNSPPRTGLKALSPNSKRISPPQHEKGQSVIGLRSSRKLILQSIPSFPSLSPRR